MSNRGFLSESEVSDQILNDQNLPIYYLYLLKKTIFFFLVKVEVLAGEKAIAMT